MSVFIFIFFVVLVGFAFTFLLYRECKKKNMMVWLPSYIRRQRPGKQPGLTHVMFCFVDHYEPKWNGADTVTQDARVQDWFDAYPKMAKEFSDSDGNHPKHSFFFPEEEYEKHHLDQLSSICHQGLGELEIHIHHDHDTPEGLSEKLQRFISILHNDHGALAIDPKTNKPTFSFIHGNWALDNSSNGHDCGVDNELIVLAKNGCYADMTFPSAPSATQPTTINSIYYATDDPLKSKSHDTGIALTVGGSAQGDLLMIQGPLGLNWKWRKFGLIPRIENGEIRDNSPPSEVRVDAWIKEGVHVQGKPDWIFVKIYTHGTQEPSRNALLGPPIRNMHRYLTTQYNDGKHYALHYVSARELYNIVKAAEAGKEGNPNEFRDFILKRPSFKPMPQ
jgi:hypothetical protein